MKKEYKQKIEVNLISKDFPALMRFAHAFYTLAERIKQQADDEDVYVNYMVIKNSTEPKVKDMPPQHLMFYDKERKEGVDVDIIGNRVVAETLTPEDMR